MRVAPRVKHNHNGTVTVSGIDYHDFRSLMTQASLSMYDFVDKHTKSGKPMDPDSAIWINRLQMIVRMMEPPRREDPYKDIPVSLLQPHQVAQRLSHIRQERLYRIEVDKILAELFD